MSQLPKLPVVERPAGKGFKSFGACGLGFEDMIVVGALLMGAATLLPLNVTVDTGPLCAFKKVKGRTSCLLGSDMGWEWGSLH